MLHVAVVERTDPQHQAIPVRELQLTGDRGALAQLAEHVVAAIRDGKCTASMFSYEPGLSVCIRTEVD